MDRRGSRVTPSLQPRASREPLAWTAAPLAYFRARLAERFGPVLGPVLSPVATPIGAAIRHFGRSRLPVAIVLVTGGVLVVFRLLNLYPWNLPVLDFHAYWESRDVINYGAYGPFVIGAFLYSPAFAQAIAPLTQLPWQVFAAVWTVILVGTYIWLAGRWAFALLASVVVALEIYLGQVDLLVAAAIVISFRYPVAWAFPLLTKVSPGIGLLWYVFRREWRNLLIALSATFAIAAVSAILAPTLWRGWIDLLLREVGQAQTIHGLYVSAPYWLRLPIAVVLLAWGARTDRAWVVPVAAFLATPILWFNTFTLLVGVIPLVAWFGPTPAREWLLGSLAGQRERAARPIVPRRGLRWPAI
jgi:glycosyl transferase family 87